MFKNESVSHFSFIPIHKCPFVEKRKENTITDTLIVENSRFEIFFCQKLCEDSVARGLCECVRALRKRLRARA